MTHKDNNIEVGPGPERGPLSPPSISAKKFFAGKQQPNKSKTKTINLFNTATNTYGIDKLPGFK